MVVGGDVAVSNLAKHVHPSVSLTATAIATESRLDVLDSSFGVIGFTFVLGDKVVNASLLHQFLHFLVFEFHTLIGPEILRTPPLLQN